MWRGSFESEDRSDGRRVYRLKWQQPKEEATSEAMLLNEREILGGLFVRYLIRQGKLSELAGG